MKLIFLVSLFLLFSISGCDKLFVKTSEQPPIARVHDKYLFPEDLQAILKPGISKEDSALIVRNYVDRWIRAQIMVKKAEENLTDTEKDLEKQIENYRASILTYRYKQQMIEQNLDTIVEKSEIETYYNENPSNFLLPEAIVKAVFVKIKRNAPELYNLRAWYRSEDVEDLDKLENYCYQNSAEYEIYNERWVYFDELLRKIPREIDNKERFLLYNRRIESQDNEFLYLLSIRDYKINGDVSPLSMVEDDIKAILLNKRKLKYIDELENDIYRDAQNRNYFEIY